MRRYRGFSQWQKSSQIWTGRTGCLFSVHWFCRLHIGWPPWTFFGIWLAEGTTRANGPVLHCPHPPPRPGAGYPAPGHLLKNVPRKTSVQRSIFNVRREKPGLMFNVLWLTRKTVQSLLLACRRVQGPEELQTLLILNFQFSTLNSVFTSNCKQQTS